MQVGHKKVMQQLKGLPRPRRILSLTRRANGDRLNVFYEWRAEHVLEQRDIRHN